MAHGVLLSRSGTPLISPAVQDVLRSVCGLSCSLRPAWRARRRSRPAAAAGLRRDELGYANRGTVHRLVREALEAQQAESVDLLRTVEVQRPDALQASLWPFALAGHGEAAKACLRIILARSKLLGLVETRKPGRIGC